MARKQGLPVHPPIVAHHVHPWRKPTTANDVIARVGGRHTAHGTGPGLQAAATSHRSESGGVETTESVTPGRVFATHSGRGQIRTGKNRYRLNYIRAKRADTSSAWINSIFLVMNLLILLKIFFAPWIKAVHQPLSRIWTSAWALLRYRFAGLGLKMPGVARDENAVLTWVPGF